MSIATALGKSQAAARQTVHRARERVRADRPRFAAPPDAKERLLGRFIGALETGDKDVFSRSSPRTPGIGWLMR